MLRRSFDNRLGSQHCIQHSRRRFSLYSSVYMEHETGIGNQLYRAEVRSGEPTTATTYNNAWISVYANIKNAKIVINKCQEDPSEKAM